MKRLVLVRHGKSSWRHPVDDFDRPLAGRGKRDVPTMGRRLARWGVDPDAIVTSPARRARSTARRLADALDFSRDDIVEEPDVYGAGTGTLLAIVRDLDDRWDEVVLVGHNPGFTDLGNLLAGIDLDNVPTCGALDLAFDLAHWADIVPGTGRLDRFDYPKKPDPTD